MEVPRIEKMTRYVDIPQNQEIEQIIEIPKVEIIDEVNEYEVLKTVNKYVEVVREERVIKYVDVPVIREVEQIIEIDKVEVVEKVVEVPIVKKVQKYVEVPQVQKIPRYVDVVEEQMQDQIIEIPRIEYVDKVVEVPLVKKVHKFVEVPTVQYIDKVVDVPRITTIEKLIEIPKNEFVEVEEETRYEQVDLGTTKVDAPIEHEEVTVQGEQMDAITGGTYHHWDHSVRPPSGVLGVQQPMLLNSVNTPMGDAHSNLGGSVSGSQMIGGGGNLGGSLLGLAAVPSFVSQPALVNRSSTHNLLNANNSVVQGFKAHMESSSTLNAKALNQVTLPAMPSLSFNRPMLGNTPILGSPAPSSRVTAMPIPLAATEMVI